MNYTSIKLLSMNEVLYFHDRFLAELINFFNNHSNVRIIKIILGGTLDKIFSVEKALSKSIPCLFLEVKPYITIFE